MVDVLGAGVLCGGSEDVDDDVVVHPHRGKEHLAAAPLVDADPGKAKKVLVEGQ